MSKQVEQQIIDRLNRWISDASGPVTVDMVNAIALILQRKPEERIMVLDACSTFFCLCCGNDIAPGDRCHCNNDE